MRRTVSHLHPRRTGGVALVATLLALAAASPAHAIVGGTASAPGQWPWMVSVLDAYTANPAWAQFCGGAVIAPRRVLTAAHCVIDRGPGDVEVLIGQPRLSAGGGRRVRVAAVDVHPGYVLSTTPNADAAVLTLAQDAGVPALAIAGPGQEPLWSAGTTARVIGWGALNPRRTRNGNWYYADRLRELQVPIASDEACESAYGIGFPSFPYLPAWVVCAGTVDGTSGTCFGDSGGPLVVETPAGWLGVGIVNGGEGCAAKGYHDLYVRADAVRTFALGPFQPRAPVVWPAPRVRGRLVAGAIVRCHPVRAPGRAPRVMVYWRRIGDRSQRIVGRGSRYRLTAEDARSGVVCTAVALDGRTRHVASRALTT